MLEADGDDVRRECGMERIKVIFDEITKADGEKMVEFISGFWWIIVGFTLVLPTKTFESSAGYRLFVEAHIAEDALGAFFILIGLITWIVLRSGKVQARRWVMLISCGFYSAIATLFLLAGPTAGTGYYANALMDLWAYLHLRNLLGQK